MQLEATASPPIARYLGEVKAAFLHTIAVLLIILDTQDD